MAELSDLKSIDKMVLRLIQEQPDYKPTNMCLTAANYLGSLGLATYVGGLRYELTSAGKELYHERKVFLDSHAPEKGVVKKEQKLLSYV